MSDSYVPDNLKELCRYGTFLCVKVPSIILNEECDPMGRYDSVRQSLTELQETEWLNVVIRNYGEETEIKITHNRR